MKRARGLFLMLAACGFGSPSVERTDAPPVDAPPDAPRAPCDLDDTWEQGKQPARTVHVSKTPGPGTPDGSAQNPFLSLGAAIPSIEPGVRILLGPGDHAGATITNRRGTADAPIWIEGPATGEPARIVGGSGTGLHLVGPQYWVIRNLEVTGLTQQPGIHVDDGGTPGSAHHVVIERVRVASVVRPCLQLGGVDDVTIRDATLASCDRGVMMLGVRTATIARTTISSVDTAGIALAGGSTDVDVRQNVIANVEGGIGVWIGGDSDLGQFRPPLSALAGNAEARDIRVFDNVIRDVRDAIQCSNCTSALVAHNLIRRASAYALKLHQPYVAIDSFQFVPAGGVELANNAIEIGGSAEALFDPANGTDAGSCTFRHNLWLKPGGVWAPALPSPEIGGIYGAPSGYSDAGKLCMSTGSRAAGAGTPLPEVDGTLTGACRSSPPSIGPGEPDPGC
ncbi:MAG TPA: right-handed parallel beta-helix repeat-containing protein [Kofleriaceae bacterium]|nr:right-handed parallel beta-helix repeat-containing protein [Kofleriaceae bacterium]